MKKDKNIKFNVEVDDSEVRAEMDRLEAEKEQAVAEKEQIIAEKEQLAAEKAELLNDLQRTRADFENYRKQIEIQKENERQNVKLGTVMKFLPLLDDIDRAILSYEELKPLEKSLEKTLKDLELSKIPSEEGAEFNPDLHEAVTMEGEGEKQVIAETLRPGYYYAGEVLRPSMVKVICR